MNARDDALLVLLDAWLQEARTAYRFARDAEVDRKRAGLTRPTLHEVSQLDAARTALVHASQLARVSGLLCGAPLDLRLADAWIQDSFRARFG